MLSASWCVPDLKKDFFHRPGSVKREASSGYRLGRCERRARFQGRSTLRTWIYRIVINSARNRQRWWGRWRACFVPLDPHIRSHGDPPAPTQSASPEQALSQKELADRVWRALATLPLEQRSAIILRELHGMHYAEIAFSLGVTTSAVKSRLSRARAALPKELRPR